jgi:hypothetical protein
MLTRRRARKWVCWIGIGVGGAAALLWLLSCFVMIEWETTMDSVTLGQGAIRNDWRAQQGRTPGVRFTWWLRSPWAMTWVPHYDRQFGQSVIPLWIPIAIGLYAAYRSLPERGRAGTCPACSHDLSGAPRVEVRKEHVRCTECGAICEREVAPEKEPGKGT